MHNCGVNCAGVFDHLEFDLSPPLYGVKHCASLEPFGSLAHFGTFVISGVTHVNTDDYT